MGRRPLVYAIQTAKTLRLIAKYRWLILGMIAYFAPVSPHLHLGHCEYLGRAGLVQVRDLPCSPALLIEAPRIDEAFAL